VELIFSTSLTNFAVKDPSLDCFLRFANDIRFWGIVLDVGCATSLS